MPRTRSLRIPLTEDELTALRNLAAGADLAVWARARLLGNAVSPAAPRGPRPGSGAREAQIRELHDRGLSAPAIAAEAGCSERWVRKVLKRSP